MLGEGICKPCRYVIHCRHRPGNVFCSSCIKWEPWTCAHMKQSVKFDVETTDMCPPLACRDYECAQKGECVK